MKKVVLYDGDCGFCNRIVIFILDRNKKKDIHFASIQGEYASRNLSKEEIEKLDSFFYIRNGKKMSKSTAAVNLAKDLDGWWKLMQIFWLVPKPIRDYVYGVIAKNRYRINKDNKCRLLGIEDKKRFLK